MWLRPLFGSWRRWYRLPHTLGPSPICARWLSAHRELAPVGRNERHVEDVLSAVPDLQLVRRAVVARREPVEDVALIGTDARVRVHRGVRVVADALHQDDARRLQHRVHRALEQRIATVRSAGLAGAQSAGRTDVRPPAGE